MTLYKSKLERETEHSENELFNFLEKTLRLTRQERDEFAEKLGEYLADVAKHYAQDAIDFKFNEGDYRR